MEHRNTVKKSSVSSFQDFRQECFARWDRRSLLTLFAAGPSIRLKSQHTFVVEEYHAEYSIGDGCAARFWRGCDGPGATAHDAGTASSRETWNAAGRSRKRRRGRVASWHHADRRREGERERREHEIRGAVQGDRQAVQAAARSDARGASEGRHGCDENAHAADVRRARSDEDVDGVRAG